MISYRLESNLNEWALNKMEETIHPLVALITDFVEESNSIDELISLIIENVPFNVSTWLKQDYVPENEIWKWLSNTGSSNCKMVIEVKSIYRDYQLKKILE
jgi:superfamily I DNA and RNA helicase